jgi:CPA2 family monovalent cation:H+ antiporter-2
MALGVLLMQDLAIVPLMLLVPFLAGEVQGVLPLGLTLLKAAGVVAGVLLAARLLVPALLHRVVRTRSRELFLTLLIVLCLGTAWLTAEVGLSLALGAFLAGLAIKESEYSHQALAEAAPFRDAFATLFFVSVGMLMDLRFAASHLVVVLAAVLLVIVLKALTASLPVLLLGYPLRVGVASGLVLAQVGEFSFVLAHTGLSHGLLQVADYQLFLSVAVSTMLLTPLLVHGGQALGQRLAFAGSIVSWLPRDAVAAQKAEPLSDHVVIVGFGLNGRNLARTLQATQVPYIILELNPATVKQARAAGEPIHYGDCAREEVLESVGITRARVMVLAISEAASVRAAVSRARGMNDRLHIIARTRFVSEVEPLRKLGADEVIPEEFETSIEIFSHVLARYDVPEHVVAGCTKRMRGGMYEMLRRAGPHSAGQLLRAAGVDRAQVHTLVLGEDWPAVGQTLGKLRVRDQTGVLVIAMQRDSDSVLNPGADTVLQAGDVLVVLAEAGQTESLRALLQRPAQ